MEGDPPDGEKTGGPEGGLPEVAGQGQDSNGSQPRANSTGRVDEEARAERIQMADVQSRSADRQAEAGGKADGSKKLNAGDIFGRGGGMPQARSSRPTEGGSTGGMMLEQARNIRDYMAEKKLACYKVRSSDGQMLNQLIEVIEEAIGATFCQDEVLAPARRHIKVNGRNGLGSGAVTCVFLPSNQLEKLDAIVPPGGSREGFASARAVIDATVTRDYMGGALGGTVTCLWGLDDAMAIKKITSYPCKAAVLSTILVQEWAAQFKKDPTEARFQVVRRVCGTYHSAERKGQVEVYANAIEVASEATEQRRQIGQLLDLDKLGDRSDIGVPLLQRLSMELYFEKGKHSSIARDKALGGSASQEQCNRTMVMYNITKDVELGEQQLKEGIMAAAQADTLDSMLIKEVDIESVSFYNNGRTGDRFAKVRFSSVEVFSYFFWLEGSSKIQQFHDGKGRAGVKLVRDKPLIARQRLTEQRMQQPNQARKSDWSGVVSGRGAPAPASSEIDLDALADKVADRLAAKLAEMNGVFIQAMATTMTAIMNKMMQNLLSPIRGRLEEVYDAIPMLPAQEAPGPEIQFPNDQRQQMDRDGPASGRRLRLDDESEMLQEQGDEMQRRQAGRVNLQQQTFSEQSQALQQNQMMQQFAQQQQMLQQMAAIQAGMNLQSPR